MIPKHVIQEVIAKSDLLSVIGEHVKLKPHSGGKYHMGCCPFHDDETPSFSVRPDDDAYSCFGCDAHGDALTFRMKYEGISFIEAITSLAEEAGVTLPEYRQDDDSDKDVAFVLRKLEQSQAIYQQELVDDAGAIAYLKNRGVSAQTAARFGLGFAPGSGMLMRSSLIEYPGDDTYLVRAGLIRGTDVDRAGMDRFTNRITFPLRNSRGHVVGYSGRYIGSSDQAPKYLNSPETEVFKKSEYVYGLYEIRQRTRNPERILVVEGQFDVVAVDDAGLNAVASLGTAIRTNQISALFRHTDELVFCFDGDAAGRKAQTKALRVAAPAMTTGRTARFLTLPEGLDPDNMLKQHGKEKFEQLCTAASSFSQSLLQYASNNQPPSTPEQRAEAAEAAVGIIRLMPRSTLRDSVVNEVADHLKLGYAQMMAHINASPPTRDSAEKNTPVSTDYSAELKQVANQVRADPVATLLHLVLRHPQTADYVKSQLPDDTVFLPRGSVLSAVLTNIQAPSETPTNEQPQTRSQQTQQWLSQCEQSHPFGDLKLPDDRVRIKTLIDNAIQWSSHNIDAIKQFSEIDAWDSAPSTEHNPRV